MPSSWLEIPLADYEGHMAHPAVGQAQLLSDHLSALLAEYTPRSVAVLGCSGGNGFEHLGQAGIRRAVGVDINPQYVDTTRRRYAARLPHLEMYVADVESASLRFEPVELIYAGLLLEYVDLGAALRTISACCTSGAILAVVSQLPNKVLPAVSASPYPSLQRLSAALRLTDRTELEVAAAAVSFERVRARTVVLPSGKAFALEEFRRLHPNVLPHASL